MSTLQKLSLALVGTAVVFMSANPANAVSLSTGGQIVAEKGQKTIISGATTIDFDSGTVSDPNATYSTTSGIVQGSVANEYAAPPDDTSKYLTISSNPVTINFAKALDYFGLYLGSVDSYNTIAFFNGNTLVKSFEGFSGLGVPEHDSVFANFSADAGETFDRVVLSSNQPAFESDNHAYRFASVPEPTSMLGLLAFGAVSAGSFIKRKSKLVELSLSK